MEKDLERKRVYAADIIRRTKAARIHRGLTQEELAQALDIDLSKYKKYEVQSPLPHYLLQPFCLITNITIEYLIIGRDKSRVIPMRKHQMTA